MAKNANAKENKDANTSTVPKQEVVRPKDKQVSGAQRSDGDHPKGGDRSGSRSGGKGSDVVRAGDVPGKDGAGASSAGHVGEAPGAPLGEVLAAVAKPDKPVKAKKSGKLHGEELLKVLKFDLDRRTTNLIRKLGGLPRSFAKNVRRQGKHFWPLSQLHERVRDLEANLHK